MNKRNEKKKTASIKSVAQNAGVSVATVSRYINGTGYVNKETGEKIRQAIEACGYVQNIVARSLKKQDSQMIVLAVPDIENPFFSLMAATTQRLLCEKGYIMVLYNTQMSALDLDAMLLARQINASGILFATNHFSDELVDEIKKYQIPVVGLNAYRENLPFDVVHVQGSQGTYLAAKHLIEYGHTRLCFAGTTKESMIGISRLEGFELAVREAGLTVPKKKILLQGFSQKDGYRMGEQIASFDELPSAVCCANDQIALGVISALRKKGLSVPKDISVTGLDDIPYASVSIPSLTTVTNDSEIFTREGVRMLMERINSTYQGSAREVVIPNELIVRESSIPFCCENNEII